MGWGHQQVGNHQLKPCFCLDFDSPPEIASMSDELQKQMEKMNTGSVALIYCDKGN